MLLENSMILYAACISESKQLLPKDWGFCARFAATSSGRLSGL